MRDPSAAQTTVDRFGAVHDAQTTTPADEPVRDVIVGAQLPLAVTDVDDRGEACEIFDPALGVLPKSLVYVYQTLVQPGKTKG